MKQISRLKFLSNKIPFFFLFLILISSAVFSAPAPQKQDVLAKYEKVVFLAEELNVYQENTGQVVPKIQLALQALLRNDLEQADRALDEAARDLDWIQSQRPGRSQNAFQLKWLEIYRDIVQKFAVLALFAFLFIRTPFFKKQILAGRLSAAARFYFVLLAAFVAILFSFFDLSRYGESAWAFMDIQVIIAAAGGLLAGLIPGLCLGMLVGAFRLILNMNFWGYFIIVAASGAVGGLFSYAVKDYKKLKLWALAAGLTAGLIHALGVYIPLVSVMGWKSVFFAAGFVAVLEAAAVFMIAGIVSHQLQEENKREMEKELLTTKLNFLQAQINPHFLYNALNTISAICSQEKAVRAQELILRLAEFFRATLKRAEDSVTLKEEMAHLDAYLAIEKARFQERLQIEKNIQLSDSAWHTKMPFLILQPLVENSIKHGISKKQGGGKVEISAVEKNGSLVFQVKDDGVGMSAAAIENLLKGQPVSEGSGIGVQNVKQRLSNWNQFKSSLRFESKPHEGTLVTFEIPVKR